MESKHRKLLFPTSKLSEHCVARCDDTTESQFSCSNKKGMFFERKIDMSEDG